MQTSIRRFSLFAALVLVMTACLLALAGPALAWWPMWGHPAMPFGGQPPTEMQGTATATPGDLDALFAGLDPGTPYFDTPRPGERLLLGWRYVAHWYSATGPCAGRVTGYLLYNWNDIVRSEADATTHWGTSIVTSVDPADYWPCLPPKSTWLWTGRLQGVTFLLTAGVSTASRSSGPAASGTVGSGPTSPGPSSIPGMSTANRGW